MQSFYKKLDKDKIKINWNKKPIKMEMFLSFLTAETERQEKFLGSDNGWTKLTGENHLDICGGVVKGVEYLDSIQYRRNLDNPYNHYVNPFYLFDIMNDEGKEFFLSYYAEDITETLKNAKDREEAAKSYKKTLFGFWEDLGVNVSDI